MAKPYISNLSQELAKKTHSFQFQFLQFQLLTLAVWTLTWHACSSCAGDATAEMTCLMQRTLTRQVETAHVWSRDRFQLTSHWLINAGQMLVDCVYMVIFVFSCKGLRTNEFDTWQGILLSDPMEKVPRGTKHVLSDVLWGKCWKKNIEKPWKETHNFTMCFFSCGGRYAHPTSWISFLKTPGRHRQAWARFQQLGRWGSPW